MSMRKAYYIKAKNKFLSQVTADNLATEELRRKTLPLKNENQADVSSDVFFAAQDAAFSIMASTLRHYGGEGGPFHCRRLSHPQMSVLINEAEALIKKKFDEHNDLLRRDFVFIGNIFDPDTWKCAQHAALAEVRASLWEYNSRQSTALLRMASNIWAAIRKHWLKVAYTLVLFLVGAAYEANTRGFGDYWDRICTYDLICQIARRN